MSARAPDPEPSELDEKTIPEPPAAPEAPGSPAESSEPPPSGPEPPLAGELAELRDRWLRSEAELQNVRRRAAREREDAWRAAEEGVLLELIAVLDDLDRALESAEAAAPEAWTEGIRMIADRTRERLARYGVVVLDPLGKPFDPHFEEALLEIDAPDGTSPGAVVQVVHKGYARGDRALRAARVVVARAPAGGESR
jgi:molecular chaperone GrpE